MIQFIISDDSNNSNIYDLKSYEITLKGQNVLVSFHSSDLSISYELKPDERFKSQDIIIDSLTNMLKKAETNGFTLQISEYLVRFYVSIGYESEEEYCFNQFTASKV